MVTAVQKKINPAAKPGILKKGRTQARLKSCLFLKDRRREATGGIYFLLQVLPPGITPVIPFPKDRRREATGGIYFLLQVLPPGITPVIPSPKDRRREATGGI